MSFFINKQAQADKDSPLIMRIKAAESRGSDFSKVAKLPFLIKSEVKGFGSDGFWWEKINGEGKGIFSPS